MDSENKRDILFPDGLNVLSLCDGISCGMVALERTGIPVKRYVAYEIESNAIKISKKNYPFIEQCGDVTKANFEQYKGFDLLMSGTPCQSVSVTRADIRTGLEGKSKLFFEFVRALQEVEPRYYLFENVASMDEESKGVISELLGTEPLLIDSRYFSAQQRPRYYWTNIPGVSNTPPSCSDQVLKDIMISANMVPEKYWYTKYPIVNIDMNKQVCGTLVHNNHEINKRLFNPNYKCHTLTCVTGGNQQKKVLIKTTENGSDLYRARKLMPIEYERLQTLPDNYTEGVSDGARYTAIGNGWTIDVITYILKHLNLK